MSKESLPEGSFDLERLKKLLQMMQKYDVTEVDLKNVDEKWKISRGPRSAPAMMPGMMPMHMAPPPPPAAPAPPPPPAAAAPPAAAKPADKPGITINSPTVGTFYSSPNPEEPVFVNVGSKVSPDTIVCIVEAMKVFNQIPAEVSGTIAEVLVKNGDPVEFGQPLFRVE